jgi:hypothetical protein
MRSATTVSSSKPPASYLAPDADQVTGDLVALGKSIQGLASQILLRHLALELDGIAVVLGHGLSPRKPGSDSPIRVTMSVHPEGCSPDKGATLDVD